MMMIISMADVHVFVHHESDWDGIRLIKMTFMTQDHLKGMIKKRGIRVRVWLKVVGSAFELDWPNLITTSENLGLMISSVNKYLPKCVNIQIKKNITNNKKKTKNG